MYGVMSVTATAGNKTGKTGACWWGSDMEEKRNGKTYRVSDSLFLDERYLKADGKLGFLHLPTL